MATTLRIGRFPWTAPRLTARLKLRSHLRRDDSEGPAWISSSGAGGTPGEIPRILRGDVPTCERGCQLTVRSPHTAETLTVEMAERDDKQFAH